MPAVCQSRGLRGKEGAELNIWGECGAAAENRGGRGDENEVGWVCTVQASGEDGLLPFCGARVYGIHFFYQRKLCTFVQLSSP